ncbi:oligosaccharide flippase family protein [Ramlibacter tataouinensis]|uniref:oligosaccharide flippase family protein n=1 Tax=Ramlibacter tataouinensis TaxID=94132 RepID=UPI0022F3CBCF|nr:oligosaccharide flippase family protein [Ramlibacter tataouinensis]WBY00794.1 oligosaccharide flippase family protein [Ramlibacter tataouinensis]
MGNPLRVSAPLLHRFSDTGAKVAALAAAQGAIYSFPVVFAVVCARNLGAAQYGVVAFYTALTTFLCMFVEFGFDSIGVREVHSSHWRDRPAQILWNVTLAKLMISLPTCVVVLPILLATRSPAETSMSYAMVVYMVAFALEPGWYLRSLELMWSAALVALVSRGVGIAVLVKTVTAPEDLTLAMWAYAFVAWASAIVGWLLLHKYRLLKRPRIDVPQLRSLFRSGTAIVLGNLSGASITSGGVVALGAIADPVLTGAANIALRIRSAGLALLVPLGQFGYVRLSALMADRAAAVRFGRSLFYQLMACSVVIALVISSHVGSIVPFAYGPSQAPVAAFMLTSLIALSLPVCMAGALFGVQCLTLFHKERVYVLIEMAAAAIFFGLLIAFRGAPAGFGWALLAADVSAAVAAGLVLRRLALSDAKA